MIPFLSQKGDVFLSVLHMLFGILMGIFKVFGWKDVDHEPIFIFLKGLDDLGRGRGLSFFPHVHIRND